MSDQQIADKGQRDQRKFTCDLLAGRADAVSRAPRPRPGNPGVVLIAGSHG